MSDTFTTIERALGELFAEGPNRSLLPQYMAESAWNEDLIALVRAHYTQLYEAAYQEQLKHHPHEPAAALSAASDQTLSLLFRMGFEAGRFAEREEALSLHQLIGMEDGT